MDKIIDVFFHAQPVNTCLHLTVTGIMNFLLHTVSNISATLQGCRWSAMVKTLDTSFKWDAEVVIWHLILNLSTILAVSNVENLNHIWDMAAEEHARLVINQSKWNILGYSLHRHHECAWWNDWRVINRFKQPARKPAGSQQQMHKHTHKYTHRMCIKLCLIHNKCQVCAVQQCEAWPAPREAPANVP